jgi:hypothetical protein
MPGRSITSLARQTQVKQNESCGSHFVNLLGFIRQIKWRPEQFFFARNGVRCAAHTPPQLCSGLFPFFRPADSQQKRAILKSFDVMRKGVIERQQTSRRQVKDLPLDVHPNVTRMSLHRNSAGCFVFVKTRIGLQYGQHNSKIRVFDERLRIPSSLPRILLA